MTKQQNIRCLIKAEVIYQFIQDNNLTKKQFCEKCKISQSTFLECLVAITLGLVQFLKSLFLCIKKLQTSAILSI